MKKFEIVSVNISEEKGTVKHPVDSIELTNEGVLHDAHAGKWHRQVSLLAKESIEKAEQMADRSFPDGTFAENITTRGLELHKARVLDRFVGENTELEVTQIGKKCHAKCAIGKAVGNCIMPVEGIFARVLRQGTVRAGDTFIYQPYTFRIMVITLSDRAFSGEYEDKSGPKIKEYCNNWAEEKQLRTNIDQIIMPDEVKLLSAEVEKAFSSSYDMVFTTGSTGIGERDIVPETIRPMLDKEIPGIMEMVRMKYGMDKPNALLSRALCGVKARTLVFSLPGSPKAVVEYMEEISKVLFHSILMIHGIGDH